jgi:hypothetical protein
MNNSVGEISKGGGPAWAFDMLAGFPVNWRHKAAELDRMVRLGYQAFQQDLIKIKGAVVANVNPSMEPSVFDVSFFLAALAIENLLKGALVFAHPEYIKDGKFRGNTIGSHDLVLIAKDAGILLNSDETMFCEIGTEAIMSFGRYHTGKNMNNASTRRTIKVSAFAVYEGLYQKLWEYIEKNPVPPNAQPNKA